MGSDAIDLTSRSKVEAHAIRLCLDELVSHAEAQGLILAANLIGAASRAISDEIIQKDAAGSRYISDEQPKAKTKMN